jgi:hypothetical protein
MSVAELWQDMYYEAVRRERELRYKLHEQRMRVIRLEGQRYSMLYHLEFACDCLAKSHPLVCAQLRAHIQTWNSEYVEEKSTVQPFRQTAPDPAPEHGPAGPARDASVYTEAGATKIAPF